MTILILAIMILNLKIESIKKVAVYIKDNIKYNVRTDLQQMKSPENVESLFIKIDRLASKNIVVGVMYRPPDQNVNEFNKYIDNVLTHAYKKPENCLSYG